MGMESDQLNPQLHQLIINLIDPFVNNHFSNLLLLKQLAEIRSSAKDFKFAVL
jgi:hypothetical protein